ncbi:MAG: hypothetical protein U0529_23075 [Thermoanaerobaculia bacterium]
MKRIPRALLPLAISSLALALAAPAALPAERPAPPALQPELEPLRPFTGKTWRGLVNEEKKLYDVSRWEIVLGGRAVRILHSVGDGVYGGEALVRWDPVAKEIVYDYVTTATFTTRGTVTVVGPGKVETREVVRGEAGGVTEVRGVTEILPDGRLKVSTRMLRNGEWKENPPKTYAEDPAAKIVLP